MKKETKIMVAIFIVIIIGAIAIYFATKNKAQATTTTKTSSGVGSILSAWLSAKAGSNSNDGESGWFKNLFDRENSDPDLEPETYHDSDGNTWTI